MHGKRPEDVSGERGEAGKIGEEMEEEARVEGVRLGGRGGSTRFYGEDCGRRLQIGSTKRPRSEQRPVEIGR